ncbi:glycoside hydrolase family 26 protein [Rhodovulum sulfidophilum]|uniref:Beta-mannosidase n=1 Tax=Rhodovulum sulfidophilum TaxID=35806 RepID=A0ABS1RN53_RHOSU|nr:glycosyl hydrolase [Rhodovulum sulfidophilum]MBL3607348.1 beta-mannosidase [Rhodovulum sulfidophilum]MCE8456031.1 beta-mannosidase [Rhodovulum sulfidophilum]
MRPDPAIAAPSLVAPRLAALSLAALSLATAAPAEPVEAPPGEMPFGVYDPDGAFADDPEVSIEHLFLPWEDVYLPSLIDADAYARARGRSVLATIEPWTWNRSERNTPDMLQEGIASGDYDRYMASICAVLNLFESPVTVRWAQEMEDDSGQFIWAGWDPATYKAAYRRMVDICRETAPEVAYMWSPLGEEGLEAYYPGDDYVDIVGLSVFGLQPWETAILGEEQSFRSILAPRYARVAAFGKPVVVAELGYSGQEDYVAKWTSEVRQIFPEFPNLVAVIYFNQIEVYPWPDGYGLPDWKVGDRIIAP